MITDGTAILNACPDCIYVYDRSLRRTVYANRRLHTALGYTDSEVERPDAVIPQRLLAPEDMVEAETFLASISALGSGDVREIELRLRARDGSWRHYAIRLRPLPESSSQVMGIARDVTALRRAEAAEHAARAAEAATIARLSHELRTPSHGICAATELLLETDLDTEQAEYARAISFGCDALRATVARILGDAATSFAEPPPLLPLDLVATIEDAVAPFAAMAASKGLGFHVTTLGDRPPPVQSDAETLRQIVANLVANAVKYTQRGDVRTVIETSAAPHESFVDVAITVADTGVGIPESFLGSLFLPYQRGDMARSSAQEGSGLGLAIVRERIDALGGTITVESREGEGSRFKVALRLARNPDGVPDPLPLYWRSRRVIVVADLPASGASLRQSLIGLGAHAELFPVTTLESRTAVRRRLRAVEHGDVVIFDGQTGSSGSFAVLVAEAAPHCRSRDATVALIAPAGAGFRSLAQRRDELGLSACLAQPATPRRIAQALTAPRRSPDEPKATAAEERRPLILAVDDNDGNLALLARMIQRAGYRCRTAVSADAALAIVRDETPALILLDCFMPGKDGFAAAREIRADPRGAAVPIVALTASPPGAVERQCREVGMNDIMTKPLRLAQLKACLERWSLQVGG